MKALSFLKKLPAPYLITSWVMFTEDGNISGNGNMFLGTLGDSKLKYSKILIWLLCMWIQLINILPSNDLIDI